MFALMSFVVAVTFRTLLSFLPSITIFTALFYIFFVSGIVLLGVETFKQKEFANAFNFENKFHLNFFGALAGVGLFIDFISSIFGLYSLFADKSHNALATGIPLGFECVLAFLGILCFWMVSASFSKGRRYDFRQLKYLNIAPLFWITSKGIVTLSNIADISEIDNVLMYLSIIFGMLTFYYFARETESVTGATASCIFYFRVFTFVALMMFISRLELILGGVASVGDRNSLFAITILLVGAFVYFLEKNIFAYTKLD